MPRLLERAALTSEEVTITDDALREVAAHYTREAGVRGMERLIAKAFRKVALGELPAVIELASLKDSDRTPAVPAGVGRADGVAGAWRPGSR